MPEKELMLDPDHILPSGSLLQFLRYCNHRWKQLLVDASGGTVQDKAIRKEVLGALKEVKTEKTAPPAQDLVYSLRRIIDMQAS
ncbi:hypothetical protein CCR75_005590 [Bremia lactucae]|uniref:Uncharacterized protein n=1 Tax=Bremia lactucae TaxID=4779 RepID=A0A976ILQ5_BRELC|nr:hypothetical protein CCR75_005590 [Bremia lactucae]